MGKLGISIRYLILTVATLVFMFPIYWLVTLSIKSPFEWTARPPHWLPLAPTTASYQALFSGRFIWHPGGGFVEEGGFAPGAMEFLLASAATPVINSLVIAGIATLVTVVIGFLAAYSMSRYGTGGSFLFVFILTTRMVPGIAIAIPLLVVFSTLRLLDSQIIIAFLYVSITMVFVIMMMKSFIDGIPREIEEAARIDGYGTASIVFRVTLPLVKGGLAAAALFVFILNWGEFLLALIFTRKLAITIPVQIQHYFADVGFLYGMAAGLSTVAIIPIIVFTILIQRHLLRGLTFGAIKG